MYWDGHNSWGWGGWLLMTISMIVFWSLVIGVIVLVLRAARRDGVDRGHVGGPTRRPSGPPAQDVLAERYARGEIDDEEYRRRLDVLRGKHGPATTSK